MDNLYVTPLNENQAIEVCTWAYDEEFKVYNLFPWHVVKKLSLDLSIDEIREEEFLAILKESDLIGYGRLHLFNDKVFIGIGLRPDYCSNGHGESAMAIIIKEAQIRYPNTPIALEVRSFNERAIKCYKKVGFNTKYNYNRITLEGEENFIYMEYTNSNIKA